MKNFASKEELVSKNGYAALNIKAVAGELGCSSDKIDRRLEKD
ncbi:MAG: hypothetical protein PUG06_02815 [Blautia sp.]|nr:hypothetical protein [Blautia sp.]MDD6413006.1 hypothetical protein [Blautia sp.]